MACAPFRILKRSIDDGIVFYSRFLDDSGKIIATRALPGVKSLRAARTAAEAMREKVAEEAKEKAAGPKGNPEALEYILTTWTKGSAYLESRKLRGKEPCSEYVKANHSLVDRHARPYLKGLKIRDLRPEHIESMIRGLNRSGSSGRTINRVAQAVRVPVADFYRGKGLPSPLAVVSKVNENLKERGSLTRDELASLLALDMEPRTRCAILLGSLAGLRLGECRGLRLADVDGKAGILRIMNNYVSGKGRAPKCGSTRTVPAPSVVFDAIRLCLDTCPPGSRGTFVLWNATSADAPCSAQYVEKHFLEALDAIGIDAAARKERGLTFHSTRHTYVSLSRAAGVPDFVVSKLAGHTSLKTTARYEHGNAIDFTEARNRLEAAMTGTPSDDPTASRIAELEAELARLRGPKVARS